jgi:hypothetical protein
MILKALRWCLVIPSFLAVYITLVAMGTVAQFIVHKVVSIGIPLNPVLYVLDALGWVTFDCIAAFFGVWIGARVAPNRKLFAAYMLLTVTVLLKLGTIVLLLTPPFNQVQTSPIWLICVSLALATLSAAGAVRKVSEAATPSPDSHTYTDQATI